ncbi:MAG: hypothetical protein IJI14_16335 [Anaerolineaceae bacterium]|nr:hypothetical protein [Anaerolineaceae bacterium]
MSSRALIVRTIKNGYFSSWCWANGDPEIIGEILRTRFKTDDDVDELLTYKSIFGIFNDPEEDTHKNIPGSFAQLQNGLYVKYDDGKNTVVSGGLYGFFPSLTTLMQESVQFVYIYNDGNWITYKREANIRNKLEEIIKQKASQESQEPKEQQNEPAQKQTNLPIIQHGDNLRIVKAVRKMKQQRKNKKEA